jgi:hypothetical protein
MPEDAVSNESPVAVFSGIDAGAHFDEKVGTFWTRYIYLAVEACFHRSEQYLLPTKP